VAVEADAGPAVRFLADAEGRGLAHIVQQHRPGQRQRPCGHGIQHDEGVLEDVALGMELRRLLDAAHGLNLGQHHGQQAQVAQQAEGAGGLGGFQQHAVELLLDALGADAGQLRRGDADGGGGARLNGVAEHGREAHGAQQAQVVFGEAGGRISDGAQDARGQIGLAAHMVHHLVGDRIIEQPVDGEIAALRILLRGGEDHAGGPTPIGVVDVLAEGRHFKGVVVAGDLDDPESLAEGAAVGEQLLDLLGGARWWRCRCPWAAARAAGRARRRRPTRPGARPLADAPPRRVRPRRDEVVRRPGDGASATVNPPACGPSRPKPPARRSCRTRFVASGR
jgi:hypothetical protein